ncbi:MAG: hypothetical protein M0R33_03735 [Methylomonas sp.]|jgi:hypothetical protein|uniref:hypothetical protein n=1 Tax=Methylomonas sp. TaxID=418 RepID=UPI0025FDED44|nr:hypothetical protein [Methylomonas sp.]MCK9605547.1 hypothetical protein [Methylomonas sp.]
MLNRRIITILMLLTAIMPVAAAYAHHSAVGPRFSMPHGVAASSLAADTSNNPAIAPGKHCQPDKARPRVCHFHICLDCAVTVSLVFDWARDSAFYNTLLKPDSLSIVPAPVIKPPISDL